MASTTLKAETLPEPAGRRTTLAEFGARLAARRAELGNPELPRNSGKRRTASKRALLAEIDKAAAKKGFRW